MKRYDIRIPVTGCIELNDEGCWVTWNDVQENTIPIPDVRVEDEGSYDPRHRWTVYLNNLCVGIHDDRENAGNQVEYIKRALNIPQ